MPPVSALDLNCVGAILKNLKPARRSLFRHGVTPYEIKRRTSRDTVPWQGYEPPTSFSSASPATIDFCVNLDRDFQSIVVDKLSRLSRDALTEQPVGMTDSAKKKIQKEIMYSVYGKLIVADFLLVLLLPLLWSCSILTRLQLAMLTSAPASHDDFGSISNSCSVFQNLFFKKNVGHSTFYSTSL